MGAGTSEQEKLPALMGLSANTPEAQSIASLEKEQRQHLHAEQGTKKCFSIVAVAIHPMLKDLVLPGLQPSSRDWVIIATLAQGAC